ncbi:MAG: hypothetical protein ACRD3O_24595 [Terriglobia bacterium]
MKNRWVRLVTIVAAWALVVLQTCEVAVRRLRSRETVGIWLEVILLATFLTVLDRRWPPKLRVPIGWLWFSTVLCIWCLAGLGLMLLLFGALQVVLPLLVWLALRRLAPWPWVKGKWALAGLLGGGIAIGLCLVALRP